MKPLHVGLLVVGAALAGGLAVKMTEPPDLSEVADGDETAHAEPPAAVTPATAPASSDLATAASGCRSATCFRSRTSAPVFQDELKKPRATVPKTVAKQFSSPESVRLRFTRSDRSRLPLLQTRAVMPQRPSPISPFREPAAESQVEPCSCSAG